MKTMNYVFALTMMMGFSVSSMAQSNKTSNINISAKASVAIAIKVEKVTDLDFKNITPGVDKTIGFTNNVALGTETGGETTGRFTITKGARTQVILKLAPLPLSLSGPSGSTPLPITYAAQLSDGTSAPHAIADPAADILVANASTTVPYYQDTVFELDLGGTVTPAANQLSGSYTADITLTATYN